MNNDPIVDEIHQIRARLLAECDGDLDQLLDRYQRSEDPELVVTPEQVEERRRLVEQRQTGNP